MDKDVVDIRFQELMNQKEKMDYREMYILMRNLTPDQKQNASLLYLYHLADQGMTPKEIIDYVSLED